MKKYSVSVVWSRVATFEAYAESEEEFLEKAWGANPDELKNEEYLDDSFDVLENGLECIEGEEEK
jgi:hypothetical protein